MQATERGAAGSWGEFIALGLRTRPALEQGAHGLSVPGAGLFPIFISMSCFLRSRFWSMHCSNPVNKQDVVSALPNADFL